MYENKNQIYFNQKVCYYPLVDKLKVMTASANIFRKKGFEYNKSKKPKQLTFNFNEESTISRLLKKQKNINDAIHRAKRIITDICLLNDFTYFCTFTFNGELCDRYNHIECFKKIQKWLNNVSNRYNVKYLIIPELHKDGAIHFHGLLLGDIKISPAVKDNNFIYHNGKQVFNIDSWNKYGFSTVTKIESIQKTASYVTKYITKDIKKILNQYYFCSRKLNKEPITDLFHVQYDDIASKDNIIQFKLPYMDNVYLIITNCWEDIETNGYQYNEALIKSLLYDG